MGTAATNQEIKRCTLCLRERPLSCFFRKSGRLDSRCKECICKIKREKRRKQRKAKRPERKRTVMDRFNVEFEGDPDRRWLGHNLKRLLEEV
jgi:hypothetical protein